MEKNIKFIIGLILFIYGIIKISIGVVGSLLPANVQSKFKDIGVFKHTIDNDTTLAGDLFLYCLIFYGIYSVLHSLHILNILSDSFKKYVNKHAFFFVNLTIGLVLSIYYFLVLYTDLDMKSDNAYRKTYITHGLFTGLFFLIMVPLSNIYYNLKNLGMSAFTTFPIFMFFSIISTIGLLYGMIFLLKQVYDIRIFNTNFLMMLIPFNAMV